MNKQEALPIAVAAFVAVLTLVILLITNQQHAPNSLESSSWQVTNSFSLPRRALSAVIHHDYFYLVGGVDQQSHYVPEVEFAAVNKDGSLGVWHRTSALGQQRFYLAAVAYGNYLYALGGGTGDIGDNNQPVATVERARILANGSLGPWEFLGNMNTPRRGLKTVVYDGHIYALGGYNGEFLKTMERAKILTNGDLGPWITEKNESQVDRYIHSASVFKHYLVLLGGHMQNQQNLSHGDVELAPVRQDASVGQWRISGGPLIVPRFMAAAFTLGNQLYIAGGHNGAERLATVESAQINPFGELAQWRPALPLTTARSAAAVAVQGDRVYIAGGINGKRVLNTVETAVLTADGSLQP